MQICKDEDMPNRSTITRWLLRKIDADFCSNYALARELRADKYFDECIEIADDARYDWVEREGKWGVSVVCDYEHVHRSKLRIDTRKWVCGRMSSKYSEKGEGEQQQQPDSPSVINYHELPAGECPPEEEMH